jgi:hypothetical protein
MSSSRRRLTLVAAGAAALVTAGAAGAIIRANIFTIGPKGWADLVGTNVSCENVRDIQTGVRSFVCVRFNHRTGYPSKGAYGIEITTGGIVVERWPNANNRSTVVRTYCLRRVHNPLAC